MKSFPERNMFRFLRYVLLFLCIVSLFCAVSCGAPASDHTQGQGGISSEEGGLQDDQAEQGGRQDLPDGDGQEENLPGQDEVQEGKMYLKIGNTVLTATLADNQAARELAQRLPLTLDLRDYGGFEKVGSLGFSLPRADVSVTAQPGELSGKSVCSLLRAKYVVIHAPGQDRRHDGATAARNFGRGKRHGHPFR